MKTKKSRDRIKNEKKCPLLSISFDASPCNVSVSHLFLAHINTAKCMFAKLLNSPKSKKKALVVSKPFQLKNDLGVKVKFIIKCRQSDTIVSSGECDPNCSASFRFDAAKQKGRGGEPLNEQLISQRHSRPLIFASESATGNCCTLQTDANDIQ